VTGLKYFEKRKPLLERLHEVGCERDKAGNRELHYDEFCLFLLLGLFHPVVDGLRDLQQARELEKVQQRLNVRRVSLGFLSEASRVSDAELLKPILEELGGQLQPLARDPRLADVPHQITLVDGTLLGVGSTGRGGRGVPDAVYHVTARRNERQPIVREDRSGGS
jgi:hypothetical protein